MKMRTLVLSACLMCALLFVSCNKMGNSGSYIEVTVDGKTFKEKSVAVPFGVSDRMYYQHNGEKISFEMTYTSRMDELLGMPTGEYRLYGTYAAPYEDDYDPTLGKRTFDLRLGLHDNRHGDNWRPVENNSGLHKVTSIKKSEKSVIVQGEFFGKLEDGSDISGTYRVTLYPY